MDTNRYNVLKNLLDNKKYFKVICGAGNENPEEVKRLSIIYTLAGAKGIDISANPNIVKSCMEGIDYAFQISNKLNIDIGIRPFITVSVGMPGDHHVRKATINLDKCVTCNLCIAICPTDAIPTELIIEQDKCIGCGYCSAVCPQNDIISYHHDEKSLIDILPKCIDAGAENIELHAGVADDDIVLKEWTLINTINPNNFNSMCLDRLHLSNFLLEQRIKWAKEISGYKLIIQADGYPMSGGKDDFNTTFQAIATADVINKKFNKRLNKKFKVYEYLDNPETYILLSGGTNSLTATLAKQSEVNFNGVSVGSFARKIIKDIINSDSFYNSDVIQEAVPIAKDLIISNIGE